MQSLLTRLICRSLVVVTASGFTLLSCGPNGNSESQTEQVVIRPLPRPRPMPRPRPLPIRTVVPGVLRPVRPVEPLKPIFPGPVIPAERLLTPKFQILNRWFLNGEEIATVPASTRIESGPGVVTPSGTLFDGSAGPIPGSAGGDDGFVAQVVAAANLVQRFANEPPADQLVVRPFLSESSTAQLVDGKIFFWKLAADRPRVRGWTDFPVQSMLNRVLPGVAFEVQSVRIAKRSIASRRGLLQWIDLVPALDTAQVGATTPTWVIFEDSRYGLNSEKRYKVLAHLPSLATAYAVPEKSAWRHQNVAIELPGKQKMILVQDTTLAWPHNPMSPRTPSPVAAAVVGQSLISSSNENWSWEIDMQPIPGIERPIWVTGHFRPGTLNIKGQFAANHSIEIRTWKSGSTGMSGPETVAWGTIGPSSSSATFDLRQIEPASSQSWIGEAPYTRYITVRIDGRDEVVVAKIYQGVQPQFPVANGYTFPF